MTVPQLVDKTLGVPGVERCKIYCEALGVGTICVAVDEHRDPFAVLRAVRDALEPHRPAGTLYAYRLLTPVGPRELPGCQDVRLSLADRRLAARLWERLLGVALLAAWALAAGVCMAGWPS